MEDEMEDAAAGPELPPDLEEDGEDEEGRFFGGGVSRNTADLLDYVNKQDKDTQVGQHTRIVWHVLSRADDGNGSLRVSIYLGFGKRRLALRRR